MSRRRRRYGDRASAGGSRVVPYRRGESFQQRHERRLRVNAKSISWLRHWCCAHDIQFDVTNGQHHWSFRGDGWLVEWWPSSAKLIVDKEWDNGVHVHDWRQVVGIIVEVILEHRSER